MEEIRRQLLERKIMELRSNVEKLIPFEDKFFNEPKVSDLKVKVGDKTFHVCKHQLVKKSLVLETMLLSGLKEDQEGVWNLSNEDPDAVEAMLKHIYMNTKIDSFKLASSVIHLAHRYDLQDLKNECELVLLEKVTLESAEQAFYLAKKFDLNLLLIKSCQIIYFETHLDGGTLPFEPIPKRNSYLAIKNIREFHLFPLTINFTEGEFVKLRIKYVRRGSFLFEPCDKLSHDLFSVECGLRHKRDGNGFCHEVHDGDFELTFRKNSRDSPERTEVIVWNYTDETQQKRELYLCVCYYGGKY
uniref:BTB domain-containing protein n=1 Tax=Bursaphelenchus xylophilus TaxID=6326 RepID=A0A1I7RK23_BURXY